MKTIILPYKKRDSYISGVSHCILKSTFIQIKNPSADEDLIRQPYGLPPSP